MMTRKMYAQGVKKSTHPATVTRAESSMAVVQDLERLLGPAQVRGDDCARTAYAVDAGIYRVPPVAVVLPEGEESVQRVLEYARTRGIPLTARAAGTNLAGNAIGPGIVLDVSRMNRLLEVNPQERWARVQPGMVYAELNEELSRDGLRFAPDPSSGDACKLGGMVGNNSAGPHTLKYGATKDNVLALRVLLADGQWLDARPYSLGSGTRAGTPLHGCPEEGNHGGLLVQGSHAGLPLLVHLLELLQTHKALIQSRRLSVSKNSSGYNLFDLADGLDRGVLDLPRLFVGSEGTLGIVTEATLRLVARPVRTVTGLLYLCRLQEVGDAVNDLLPLGPSALEIMDASSMDLVGRSRYDIPSDAEAMLLVELDEEPLEEKVARMEEACRGYRLCIPLQVAWDATHQEALWRARKAIFPTLYRYDAHKKPINFADDVVVSARRLPELIAYLEGRFQQWGVPVAIYGHIGDGNAHINPLLDVADPKDFQRMVEISRDIHGVVMERFEGSICGEHGDGRVRAEFLPLLYGKEMYGLFKQVKALLDPSGLLNPGVKLSTTPFTENVDVERVRRPCATCGKCNAVCPAYDVSLEETIGARGWYTQLTQASMSLEDAVEAVAGCLNCKSCRVICPAGVDVSALVLEKRAQRPNRGSRWMLALLQRPGFLTPMVKAAGWTQALWDSRVGRATLEAMTRPVLRRLAPTACLPRDLALPRFATRTLRERHGSITEETPSKAGGEVAYFHGCAANYFDDGVGDAVIGLLQHHGVKVVLPLQRCSGTPMETYGHHDLVLATARFNLNSLNRFERIVTGCASCTLALKDYPRLFPSGPERGKAEAVAGRVRHISEFLIQDLNLHPDGNARDAKKTVTYHASCHMRAAGVVEAPREVLRRLPGLRFVEMRDADRCAGGAGSFSIKNPKVSRAVFGRKARGIAESGAEIVATCCPACMIQLNTGLHGRTTVKHVAQLALEALEGGYG